MTKEHGIGFYMKKINDYIIADGNEYLKQYDLTLSQMHILIHIVKAENHITTQKDIETFFKISHPTVVGLMKRLEKKSLITISHNPEDRRGNCIQATEKCIKMINSMRDGKKHIDNLLTRNLDAQQAKQLTSLLTIVYNDLYSDYPECKRFHFHS